MKRWLITLLFAMVGGFALLCAPVAMTASDTSVSPTGHTGLGYDTDSMRVVSDNVLPDSEASQQSIPSFGHVSGLIAAKSTAVSPFRYTRASETFQHYSAVEHAESLAGRLRPGDVA